jgi:16S rRNA (guanine527-N7)-methyltransferase
VGRTPGAGTRSDADFQGLVDACRDLGVEISSHQIESLRRYHQDIVDWNRRVNLVSRRDVDRLVGYHCLDSAEGLRYLRKNGDRVVLDLGSGAGFPGVVWKILHPELEMTLVESVRKRCLFLEQVVSGLGLTRTMVVRERGEELQNRKEFIGHYDVGVARTVAKLGRLIEICLPLLRRGGRLVAFKGKGASEELVEARSALERVGGSVVAVEPALSVELRRKRTFVIVEKK